MKERIITALLMIAVVGIILFLMPSLFTVLVTVVLGVAIWEWCRISKIPRNVSYGVAATTILLWIAATLFVPLLTLLLILTAVHYLYAVYLLVVYEKKHRYALNHYYLIICGPIILSTLATVLRYIFNPTEGLPTIDDALQLSFIVLIIATADSCAYFAGRFFGKHKLSPRISPKKTIEGLIGGLLGVVIVVILCRSMVETWLLPISTLLLIALISALFSVVGDLFISLIKRQHHIKDSSNILPGHGGILDRIDGLMSGIPIFYLLQQFA